MRLTSIIYRSCSSLRAWGCPRGEGLSPSCSRQTHLGVTYLCGCLRCVCISAAAVRATRLVVHVGVCTVQTSHRTTVVVVHAPDQGEEGTFRYFACNSPRSRGTLCHVVTKRLTAIGVVARRKAPLGSGIIRCSPNVCYGVGQLSPCWVGVRYRSRKPICCPNTPSTRRPERPIESLRSRPVWYGTRSNANHGWIVRWTVERCPGSRVNRWRVPRPLGLHRSHKRRTRP